MNYRFYIKTKGSVQGPFPAEAPGAGDGYSLCYRYRFKGSVNNDPTRTKQGAARSQEPLTVVKPWGAASPYFMEAFWTNEPLDSVHLLFVRADGKGNPDAPFQEIELTGATVAAIEQLAGDDVVHQGAPAELEAISFRYETMSIKNIPAKTAAKYDWRNAG